MVANRAGGVPSIDVDVVGELLRGVVDSVVLPRFRALDPDDVHEKGPDDLVTVADLETEARITEALHGMTPGIPVVGEEAVAAEPGLAAAVDDDGTCWLLDPLDGTAAFVEGRPDFGTMLALVHAGETVAAWIWLPVREHLLVAERGSGAYADGRRVLLAGDVRPWEPSDARCWASTRFLPPHLAVAIGSRTTALGHVGGGPGSAAAAYAGLAGGACDVALQWRTLPWDHAPGALVLGRPGERPGVPTGGRTAPGSARPASS